ncbi:dol-P-Glc:Glc(2)Man(9)GlcNAc(2)-PP-Dol alpha-1,2-glucosyltransferase isoform X2 [Jatropha curcas]|uniref:dol-P-Glc:Glc(2)Man(9)GlcNAc(2)-PP-Dol alpha-1,2-glucosyltransferase isoform X2 n=1 Tax=Jatropha curcas TaxID=180498 RepID=UPI0005FB8521|nr:dol-P-Glc:Glc(2)Man(9)GlcNAc(2)-PP-Dol alpha-1,2-glucosyltransferase isoform X2 [Jatropha curcas]
MGRLAIAVIVSLWVIPTSILVNRIVPEPYMDEIFHIPQAQQYCKGNFWSWDPMITTPPGLYYLSLAHVACLFPGMFLVQVVPSFSEVCSTAILRSVNGVLAVLCSIIVYEIITHLKPTLDERKATFLAVILALYPLHWFFTFLYYTDVASLTMVLAMYLACLKKNYRFSALLGAFAVFIRQTNIIWMLFVACTGVIDTTLVHQIKNVKADELDESGKGTVRLIPNNSVSASSGMRRRMPKTAVDASKYSITVNGSSTSQSSVLVAFVAFIRWNGSIVLGAKEAHVVSPHFAQIMYFSLVSTLAAAPLHFSLGHGADLFRSFWKNRPLSICQWLVALTAGFLSVHFFSIAHPYLLADNRHYPFYLWRKVIKAHWLMKYLLVPCYVYSWFSIFSTLGKIRQKIWVLAYFLATAAVLVPAPLIELRYYTIPFYFLMLHSNVNNKQSLIIMGLMYVVINAFTVIMFLFRPFHWNHEPGVQRFIW